MTEVATPKKSKVKADPPMVIEFWPIENLIPYDLNVKKHDKKQVTSIALSISKSNFHNPIMVDRDGVIIAGHGRRLAAIELGLKKVPVWHRLDLWGDTARAARLADNRTAISDIDTEMLKLELSTLDVDMTGIFDEKELTFTAADLGTMNDDIFVTDMAEVLAGQKADIDERMEKASGSERVPLSKAFGFKDVPAAGCLALTQLMARAEAETGLKNDAALVAWAKALK